MMMAEIIGEPEQTRHIATAQLGGRFADLAIELGGFLDDQDAGGRVLAF